VGALCLCFGAAASAQTVGLVVTGEPTAVASRVALRCATTLEGRDDLEVVESDALRRALAGVPAPEGAEDPLADIRRMAREAAGESPRATLERLGGRLDVDLLVTVRRVGDEAELRAFNVERGAFYRGTLMVPARGAVDADELGEFVAARAGAAGGGAASGDEEGEEGEDGGGGSRGWASWWEWWVWAVVGAAVLGVAAVAYFAFPGGTEDQDVRLRIVAP